MDQSLEEVEYIFVTLESSDHLRLVVLFHLKSYLRQNALDLLLCLFHYGIKPLFLRTEFMSPLFVFFYFYIEISLLQLLKILPELANFIML